MRKTAGNDQCGVGASILEEFIEIQSNIVTDDHVLLSSSEVLVRRNEFWSDALVDLFSPDWKKKMKSYTGEILMRI